MTFDDFARAREAERAWAYANGYNNGDAATNGEYACLDLLLPDADLFVDVGANEGLFVERARRAEELQIIAFEPNPAHAETLRARLPSRGRLEGVALGERHGAATLHIHREHHATASLTDRPRMSPRFRAQMDRVEVEVRALDAYAAELSGARLVLKIDAEGYELPVIRGARHVLEAAPAAAVMFEYSFAWQETAESMLEAFQTFDALGFDLHRILPLGLEHVRFFTNDMERAQYCNYVALKGFAPGGRPHPLATPYGETTFRAF